MLSWLKKVPIPLRILLPVQYVQIVTEYPDSVVRQKLSHNFGGLSENIHPSAIQYQKGYRTSFVDDKMRVSGPTGQRQWLIESVGRIIKNNNETAVDLYTFPNVGLLVLVFIILVIFCWIFLSNMIEFLTLFSAFILVSTYLGIVFAVQIESRRLQRALKSLLS